MDANAHVPEHFAYLVYIMLIATSITPLSLPTPHHALPDGVIGRVIWHDVGDRGGCRGGWLRPHMMGSEGWR